MSSSKLKRAWEERRLDDRGVVGGADALIFGVVSVVVTAFLILNVWAVIDAALATSAASREAARIYVESDDVGQAGANAENRARTVMQDYGKNGAVQVTGSTIFERCAVVTINVSYDVALVDLPLFGSFGSLTTIESSHSERIDPYRSGTFTGECNL